MRFRLKIPDRALWVYVLPLLHFIGCLISMIGYVMPQLSYWGIVQTFMLLADLPVSAPAYVLAWKYPAIAQIWFVVVGTWWWYVLSRAAQRMLLRIFHSKSS